MSDDPVNAAEVLDKAHFKWACIGEPGTQPGEQQVDDLLALGGGDPVVIMPDGTLLRLRRTKSGLWMDDPVRP